jgi:hypothetical protein
MDGEPLERIAICRPLSLSFTQLPRLFTRFARADSSQQVKIRSNHFDHVHSFFHFSPQARMGNPKQISVQIDVGLILVNS